MRKRRFSRRIKEKESQRLKKQKNIKLYKHIKCEQSESFITDFHRCHLCHYRTNSSYLICQHYGRHQEESLFNCAQDIPKYKCEKCELNADFAIDLKNHRCHKSRSSTKKPKSYTCEKCDFRTHSRLIELKHALFQCEDKNRLIPKQKDYFKSYQFLLQIRHSNVEWLKCEQCSYMARLEGALGSHMVTEHSRQSNLRWYNCKLCLFNVEQIFYLRQHILIEHGEDEEELGY